MSSVGPVHDYLDGLECSACSHKYNTHEPQTVCRICGHSLLARYDSAHLAGKVRPGGFAGRAPGVWRFRETNGTAISVGDDDLLAGMAELATIEGIFVCPEGATLVPAVKRLLERGDIDTRENVVLLNTGKGLKYTDLISTATASSL